MPANSAMMRRRALYKYFSERKWAEEFLKGELLFHSLSYFRDYEDNNVRGDQNEGTVIFRPDNGLVVNNLTQGTTFLLPGYAIESAVKQEEIFVLCASRSFTDKLRDRFQAVVCVEIRCVETFCNRIAAALPPAATFPGRPGRNRIGQRVQYYKETEAGNPRWALPDVIATSKVDSYAWQEEFRLVFSLTNALGFQNVDVCLTQSNAKQFWNPAEQHCYPLSARSLCDICELHEFQNAAAPLLSPAP
jgi:hypothetical protein